MRGPAFWAGISMKPWLPCYNSVCFRSEEFIYALPLPISVLIAIHACTHNENPRAAVFRGGFQEGMSPFGEDLVEGMSSTRGSSSAIPSTTTLLALIVSEPSSSESPIHAMGASQGSETIQFRLKLVLIHTCTICLHIKIIQSS